MFNYLSLALRASLILANLWLLSKIPYNIFTQLVFWHRRFNWFIYLKQIFIYSSLNIFILLAFIIERMTKAKEYFVNLKKSCNSCTTKMNIARDFGVSRQLVNVWYKLNKKWKDWLMSNRNQSDFENQRSKGINLLKELKTFKSGCTNYKGFKLWFKISRFHRKITSKEAIYLIDATTQ